MCLKGSAAEIEGKVKFVKCKFLLHDQLPSQLAHIEWMSDGFCDFTLSLGTSQGLDLALSSFKIVSNCEICGTNNFQNLGAGVVEVSYKLILILF